MKESRAPYMREYRAKRKVAANSPEPDSSELGQPPIVVPPEIPIKPPEVSVTPSPGPFCNTCEQLRDTVTSEANTAWDKMFIVEQALAGLLLFAGSLFVVTEQVRFYETCGYEFWYSLFLAMLLEITPLALAYLASRRGKPWLYCVIIPAVGCIAAVIFLGLVSRQNIAADSTSRREILTKQVKMLEEEAARVDGNAFKKVHAKLIVKLDTILAMPIETSSEPQMWVFAAIRFLALISNLVFAHLLARR